MEQIGAAAVAGAGTVHPCCDAGVDGVLICCLGFRRTHEWLGRAGGGGAERFGCGDVMSFGGSEVQVVGGVERVMDPVQLTVQQFQQANLLVSKRLSNACVPEQYLYTLHL